jgi:hypothetical protein
MSSNNDDTPRGHHVRLGENNYSWWTASVEANICQKDPDLWFTHLDPADDPALPVAAAALKKFISGEALVLSYIMRDLDPVNYQRIHLTINPATPPVGHPYKARRVWFKLRAHHVSNTPTVRTDCRAKLRHLFYDGTTSPGGWVNATRALFNTLVTNGDTLTEHTGSALIDFSPIFHLKKKVRYHRFF